MRNSKQLRRLLREYAGTAHELELRQALGPVADAVHAWELGDLDSFEVETVIHRFHQGPARELYVQYQTAVAEPALARAIATGVLERESLPAELIEHLASLIAYFEDIPE